MPWFCTSTFKFEAEKMLKGHVIANPATGRAISEIKPTPPERASALGPLQSLSVAGTIRVIRRNPRGDIDGVILEDGTLLQFLPHAGRQFANNTPAFPSPRFEMPSCLPLSQKLIME